MDGLPLWVAYGGLELDEYFGEKDRLLLIRKQRSR